MHLLAGMGTEHSLATGNPNDIFYSGSQNLDCPQFMSFGGRSIPDTSFPQADLSLLALSSAKSSPRLRVPGSAADMQNNLPMSRNVSQQSHVNASRNRSSIPTSSGVRKVMPQLSLTTGPQTKSEQQREALALSKAITQQIESSKAAGPVNIEELVFRALCAQHQNDKTGANVSRKPSSALKPTSVTGGTQKCPYTPCEFVGRNCDLNKHIKRHLRPFGCTYPKCYKRFGAKSDWKRHENSQHFQQEAYRCDYADVSKPKETCGQHFYRAEHFQEHLGQHNISSAKTKDDLERCKIGKNCQSQYWCGFCGVIMKLDKKRNEAWDERFDHIANHFDREKKCIDNWVCVEENMTKEQIRKTLVDDEVGSPDGDKDNDTDVAMAYGMSTVPSVTGSSASNFGQGPSRKRSAPEDLINTPRSAARKTERLSTTTIIIFCVSPLIRKDIPYSS